jgi:hypothetical protein
MLPAASVLAAGEARDFLEDSAVFASELDLMTGKERSNTEAFK